MERLLVLNWRFGFLMFDFQPLTAHNSRSSTPLIHRNGKNVLCNQGLASMRGGAYIASVDGDVLRLWKAREGKSAGFLKTTGLPHPCLTFRVANKASLLGREQIISAIHVRLCLSHPCKSQRHSRPHLELVMPWLLHPCVRVMV